jgi:hypothetical protein
MQRLPDLNEWEVETLRQMAKLFREGEQFLRFDDFKCSGELDPDAVKNIADRFRNLKLTTYASNARVKIEPAVLEAVHLLDNPPLPNYWESFTAWFFSKPWSVPLVAIVVLLPILVQWVQWAIALLGWLMGQEVHSDN